MKRLLLALMVAGCEQPTEPKVEVATECFNPCFKSVTAEFPMDCARFDKNVDTIIETFDSLGILSQESFCSVFVKTPIHYRVEGSYFYVGPIRAMGIAYSDGRVELTRDGLSLAHELLHIFDTDRVKKADNAAHLNWGKKKYYEADMTYKGRGYSMAPEHYEAEPLDQPLPADRK